MAYCKGLDRQCFPSHHWLGKHFLFVLLVVLTTFPFWFVGQLQAVTPTVTVNLWPNTPPGESGKIGPERIRDPKDAPTKDAQWITGVTTPTLSIYPRPSSGSSTGTTAIVICPGGGYWNLAWDLEGEEVAARLNQSGITSCLLKYRVPRRPGEPEPLPAKAPLLDAQRAIRILRLHAAEWGIDPNRIGIVGFSAGGHLSIATATHFDQNLYTAVDRADQLSSRPDFAIAVYPGYIIPQERAGVETKRDQLAPYMRIPAQTPPIYLVHASDDKVAAPENSLVLYQALRAAGISCELHLYAQGGHGFGVRPTEFPCSHWADGCLQWMHQMKLLSPSQSTPQTQTSAPLHERSNLLKSMPSPPR